MQKTRKLTLSFLTIFVMLLTSACSGNFSGGNQCQKLLNRYWAEYQAYIDARAANNGVETQEVMSHYYASGKYYLKFMDIGCENQGYSIDENSSNSSGSNVSPRTKTASGVTENYVCQQLGDIYSSYQSLLSDWRDTNSNVPYDDIFTFSDETSQIARSLANQILSAGIDWDSTAIIAGLINDFADNVDEVSNSVSKNFFSPGRDFITIQNEMDFSVNSVLNSACN